jgi:micrococcal nuclease
MFFVRGLIMKSYMLVVALAVLCLLPADAGASTLFGKVIEVNSGDVVTIFNLNRPVRVKLLGVDAPEMDQAFGDIAKKHLADLVFDRSVLVEYSGIAADSSLTGRVLLNSADIGAQMIRDGAAWFDSSNGNRLTADDREVYQQSEQAARSEKRGLWQAENPTAPWEFVKAETLRKKPAATLNSILPATKMKSQGPLPELTNLTLIAAGIPAATRPVANDADMAWAAAVPTRGEWGPFRPAGANFSVLVPVNGKRVSLPVAAGDRMVENQVYMARDGWSVYSLMWITAPTYGESDKLAVTQMLSSFLHGVGQGFQSRGQSMGQPSQFRCEIPNEKNVSMSGYTGAEFDLRSCSVPARARVFTRVVEGEREMYLGVVFYVEEDENVARFIKSFTVGSQQKPTARRR